MQGCRAPLLLLTGPAGAGKTATLSVVARELGLELQEWSNPITAAFQRDGDTDYKSGEESALAYWELGIVCESYRIIPLL